MFVVTTRKRIIQITVLAILGALCLVSYIGYRYHQNTVAQPRQLIDRLHLVAAGDNPLDAQDVNMAAILPAAKAIITDQLAAELASTNLPEGEQAVVYLIDQASRFLADEALLQQWLQQWMHKAYVTAGDQAVEVSLSAKKRLLQYADQCLLLTSEKHPWQLVSIGTCDAFNDQR